MFNFINLKLPRPSFRLFLFILFALIVLVLIAEGGYYFWVQKRMETQETKNPVIAREEGSFTYIKQPDGSIEKMILGTIRKIDGNLLTIKTDNNKIVQVLFIGEDPDITEVNFDLKIADFKVGTMADLSIGDVVNIGDIDSENKGQITAKFLEVIRDTSE